MRIRDYVRVGATAFPLWEDTHGSQSSVERAARTKLRIGHEHRCYSFKLSTTSIPALVFCVAQAFAKPCSWSHAYLVIPGVDEPLSRHFSFDPVQLNDYSLCHCRIGRRRLCLTLGTRQPLYLRPSKIGWSISLKRHQSV